MKKIVSLIIALTLVISSVSVAYAKQDNNSGKNKAQRVEQQEKKVEQQNNKETKQNSKKDNKKDKKQTFKINGSPVIKIGKYKLPIRPITKGMGATVAYDKDTKILTVTKDSTTIVINFADKTVTVNGVADTTSSIFTAKNSKKSTVLIKYIGNKLGYRVTSGDDKVTVEDGNDGTPSTSASGSAISASGSAITAAQ